jgi:hypothetical protein
MNRGLHIVCKGFFVSTICLLLVPASALSQTDATATNLLSPKNGGQIVVQTSDGWPKTIDGDESAKEFRWNEWAIYAFRDEQAAIFDTFAVLIPAEGPNLKEFELFVGNDSPTGKFESIGKFKTTNAKFTRSPYQESHFSPVTAKYLKVQIVSGWVPSNLYPVTVYQFKLLGRLKE